LVRAAILTLGPYQKKPPTHGLAVLAGAEAQGQERPRRGGFGRGGRGRTRLPGGLTLAFASKLTAGRLNTTTTGATHPAFRSVRLDCDTDGSCGGGRDISWSAMAAPSLPDNPTLDTNDSASHCQRLPMKTLPIRGQVVANGRTLCATACSSALVCNLFINRWIELHARNRRCRMQKLSTVPRRTRKASAIPS